MMTFASRKRCFSPAGKTNQPGALRRRGRTAVAMHACVVNELVTAPPGPIAPHPNPPQRGCFTRETVTDEPPGGAPPPARSRVCPDPVGRERTATTGDSLTLRDACARRAAGGRTLTVPAVSGRGYRHPGPLPDRSRPSRGRRAGPSRARRRNHPDHPRNRWWSPCACSLRPQPVTQRAPIRSDPIRSVSMVTVGNAFLLPVPRDFCFPSVKLVHHDPAGRWW